MELDRLLPGQLRDYCDAHIKAASNIQSVRDELAAAEKAERQAADERRSKKAKNKTPAAPVLAAPPPQASLSLFADELQPEQQQAPAPAAAAAAAAGEVK